MTLSLQISNSNEIQPLYHQIFGEDLSATVVARRQANGPLEFRIIADGDETIGFVILHHRLSSLHIWMMGLMPNRRGKGFGGQALDSIIDLAKVSGYALVTLSTYNHRKEMLAASIRKGFRIVATVPGHHGDNVKIRLEYKIHRKRELRIQLTGNCNFQCRFCHMEGVESVSHKTQTPDRILSLINEASATGYDDITFTGGEPLLRKKELIEVITKLGQEHQRPSYPDLTIVTNGSLLDNEAIQAFVGYPGKIKLNISLHAAEENLYCHIVQPKGNSRGVLDQVLANIRRAVEAGLTIKLNCVMMKGYNTDEAQLLAYLDLAEKLGVHTVKFLELIVLESNKAIFPQYYSADAVCVSLEKMGAQRCDTSKRVRYYRFSIYPNLGIEVSQCTCKLGCANCASVRDRTFDPELNYCPCFGDSCKIVFGNLNEMFSQGDQFIREQAGKYGKDSPSLIRQDEYIQFRDEVFFFIPGLREQAEAILTRNGFVLTKQVFFSYWHYRPQWVAKDSEWVNGTRTLKIGIEDCSSNIIEFIYSTKSLRKAGDYTLQRQQFIHGIKPPRVASRELADAVMEALSFTQYLETRHEIREFAKGTCRLSIDPVPGGCSLKIAYGLVELPPIQSMLADLSAQCIHESYNLWLERQYQAKSMK